MFTPDQDKRRGRAAARLQAGRPDRSRQLDARRLHRPAVQDDRQAHAAAGRREVAGAVGHARAARRAVRRVPAAIETQPRNFVFRYRSAQHWIEVFRTYYGPMLKAFAALPRRRSRPSRDIIALIARMNRSGDGTMVVPSEYLEVVVTKR